MGLAGSGEFALPGLHQTVETVPVWEFGWEELVYEEHGRLWGCESGCAGELTTSVFSAAPCTSQPNGTMGLFYHKTGIK